MIGILAIEMGVPYPRVDFGGTNPSDAEMSERFKAKRQRGDRLSDLMDTNWPMTTVYDWANQKTVVVPI